MSYVITAIVAFVVGLVVMGIYKQRALNYVHGEVARLKAKL
jgi:hypothetical protein